jgi:serine/threonine protein kinase
MDSPTSQAEKFGKYEIIRKLSRSMTDVYLAKDVWTNQKVVLKRIEQSRDEFTRIAIEAETRGAQIQKQLHSIDPRILAIYDCGDLGNFFFVAMEYCEGKSLAELLQSEGRLEANRAARYGAEICSLLRTLHSFVTDYAGRRTAVIHGDIKPSNIQIGLKDDVRLLDFGISKNITATQNLTRHNMGSPSYCSPERLSKGQVDVPADLWAVGVTLFEMLAGTPPYQAQDTRQLENIIQSKRPPRALPGDCPPPLKAIVSKALAGDLELRYRSAQEFENDLRGYLANQPVSAMRDRVSWDSNETVDKSVPPRMPPPAVPNGRVEPHPQPKARSNPTRLTTSQMLPAAKPATALHKWHFMRPGSTNVAIALIAGVLAGLVVFVPLVYYLRVYNEVTPLRAVRDYAHDAPAIIDSDWELYQDLKKRTQFMGILSPLNLAESRMRSNLMTAADTIIDGYRASAITNPGDFDWARARKCLRYASQIDPTDSKIKGKLALADGYVNLVQVEAAAPKVRNNPNPRLPKASLCIDDFRQAASYLPGSPDPHLGLARLNVYAFHNIGEADAEFQQAEQLGFHLGPREQAQRADGYMFRSQYELARARRSAPKNRDDAERWLQLCRDDIENARKLYEPLVGFSNVSTNLEQLDQIKLEQASLETQSTTGNQPAAVGNP